MVWFDARGGTLYKIVNFLFLLFSGHSYRKVGWKNSVLVPRSDLQMRVIRTQLEFTLYTSVEVVHESILPRLVDYNFAQKSTLVQT